MSTAGLQDLPLEIFSGLVTDIAASDLPAGASPACSDVAFILGGVKTRPGLFSSIVSPIGNAFINYLKTFQDSDLNNRLLYLDSVGNTFQEFPQGAIANLTSGPGGNGGLWPAPKNSFGQSTTLFGREYIAISDGKFGIDIPRQFDTTFYDRVSQVGPGGFPGVATDIAVAITALSRTGGVISVTTAANHGLTPGALATISGVNADASFNGQFPVLTVPDNTHFTAQGSPGIFLISTIARTGGVVSAVIAGAAPTLMGGAQIVVAGVQDTSYDGVFAVTAVAGNIVTWPQAGTNSASRGGSLYTSAGSNVEPVVRASNNVAIPNGSGQVEFVFELPLGSNLAGFAIGNTITIAGNSNGACNITAVIQEGPVVLGNLVYFGMPLQGGGSFTGAGGTATPSQANANPAASGVAGPAGLITEGTHNVVVIFVTRQGYLTMPSPAIFWVASGGFTASITGIPTGPPNVVARILAFTAAGGADYRYTTGSFGTPNLVIADNVTTTFTANFSDTTLLAGASAANLFNMVELGECTGVIAYSSRLFWWGERNKVQNLLNPTFAGGWNGNVPLGWTADPVNGGGGSADLPNALWGWAYRVTGDGATAIRGQISQSAYHDQFSQAILQQATAYSARVKLLAGGGIAQGNAVVELFSPTAGSLGTLTVPVGNLVTTGYTECIGPVCNAQGVIPADLVLRVYLNGTPTNGGWVDFANIQLFPTLAPYNNTQLRASYIEDPEAYDGVTGFITPLPNNGQSVRCAFVIREKLYIVKDKSFAETEDDGQNEPSAWTTTEISNVVGTPSANGVDVGEEWAVIASRNGLYIFWGEQPSKISQEIQSVWDSINWNAGSTLWVRVDNRNKRLLVGVPVNGATAPNKVLYFDYRGLDTAQEIADHWTVKYSSYTGKILAIGNSPKWAPWTMAINACALIERSDGTAHMFMGNGPGAGANPGTSKIYDLLDSQKSDDGVGIPWSYSTYFFPCHQDEQVLQLGAHMKLFGYLTGLVRGAGAMSITMQPIGNITPTALPNITLIDPSITGAITNLARFRGILTVTCAGGHGLTAADTNAVIAGTDDANSNETFPIMQVLNPQQFTVFQLGLPDLPPQGAGGTVARLLRDFEFTTNVECERCQYTFANAGNVPGSWFQMEKIIVSLERSAAAPVRGHA